MIELTDDEATAARWAEAGNAEPLDMTGKRLRAAAIRALLMGLPVQFADGKTEVKIPATGLRVKGARIDGDLALTDGRGPDGGPMPALVLEDCTCPSPINMDHAHIRYLSLKGSRITHLRGCGVHVESTLDLTGLGSAESMSTGFHGAPLLDGDVWPVAQGLCWVELAEAQIDGAVEANKAIFVAPTARDNFDAYAMPARYALDLSRAHIRVCVRLRDGVRAIGGISVASGEIGGDVRADGARLTTVEVCAFLGQTARIGGNVMLQAWSPPGRDTIPFSAEGEVNLMGAKIAGFLVMDGAKLIGDLVAENAEIGGDALLRANDGQTEGRPQTFPFIAEKNVNLLGAKISGTLEMDGAQLDGDLIAQAVEIGKTALLRAREGQNEGQPQTYPFTVRKNVHLLGAKITDDLDFDGAALSGDMIANNVTVGGNLLLIAQHIQSESDWVFQPLMIGKSFSLVNATVTGAMLVRLERNAYIGKPPDFSRVTTIDLRHTHVGALQDHGGRGFGTHCRLKLEGFQYDSILEDRPGKMPKPEPWQERKPSWWHLWNRQVCKHWSDMILYYLRAGLTRLQEVIRPICHPIIPIGFLAAVALAFWFGWLTAATAAWWGGGAVLLCYGLWLFKNGRFDCGRWEARIDWLNLQYESALPTLQEYSPEPYEQLARTLRTAGFYHDARKIASRRLTLERRVVTHPALRFFSWMFGTAFDYGLSPLRALVTCAFCILIGWGGVWIADNGWQTFHLAPVMFVDTTTVNTVATLNDKAPQVGLPRIAANGSTSAPLTSLPCGGTIDPLFYAIDVFVPTLDLRQESRCSFSSAQDATLWRWGDALYAILGWIVTALTILTVSGILRRHVEG